MPRKSKRKVYQQKIIDVLKNIKPYWLFTIGFVILICILFTYLLFALKGSHHTDDDADKMIEETSETKVKFNFYSSLPNMAVVPAPSQNENLPKQNIIGNAQELERDISQHIRKKERK